MTHRFPSFLFISSTFSFYPKINVVFIAVITHFACTPRAGLLGSVSPLQCFCAAVVPLSACGDSPCCLSKGRSLLSVRVLFIPAVQVRTSSLKTSIQSQIPVSCGHGGKKKKRKMEEIPSVFCVLFEFCELLGFF